MAFREGINEKLFEAALNFIDKRPRSFDMTEYQQETGRGTACCLAGVVCMLIGQEPRGSAAKNALRLRSHEADRLFKTWEWPLRLVDSMSGFGPGTPEYKDVAIRRFRHFLATGE